MKELGMNRECDVDDGVKKKAQWMPEGHLHAQGWAPTQKTEGPKVMRSS